MTLFLQTIILGLVVGLFYSMIVLAIGIIYAGQRVFHVAVGITITVNAYSYIAFALYGWPLWLNVLANVGVAFAVNCICWVIYLVMSWRGASEDVMVMGSFSLVLIGEAILNLTFGTISQSFNLPSLQNALRFGSITITKGDLILSLVAVIIWVLVWALLRWTWHGARIRATFGSARDATVAGINVRFVELICYSIGSVGCAVAAISLLLSQSVNPEFGEFPVLIGIVGAVAGGLGRIYRGAVTAVFLGLVWQFAGAYVGGAWQEGVVFAVFGIWLIGRSKGREAMAVVS